MAVSLLLGALAKAGGGDLVKQIAGGAGKAVLGKIADRYGLDVNSADFDMTAAQKIESDKESNRFIAEMRAHEVEEQKARMLDVQDARKQTQFADLVKILAIGLSIVYILVMIALFFFSSDDLAPWAEANLNQMISVLNNLLIATWAFFFGSSVGSKQKSAARAEDEKRDDMIAAQQPRIVETVSTTRPIHNPAQAAPQPAAPAPAPAPEMDEIDAAMADTVSTTRPGSNGDNIL